MLNDHNYFLTMCFFKKDFKVIALINSRSYYEYRKLHIDIKFYFKNY